MKVFLGTADPVKTLDGVRDGKEDAMVAKNVLSDIYKLLAEKKRFVCFGTTFDILN